MILFLGLIVVESPESAVEAADFFDSDASSVDALQDGKYQYLWKEQEYMIMMKKTPKWPFIKVASVNDNVFFSAMKYIVFKMIKIMWTCCIACKFCNDLIFAFFAITFTSHNIQYAEIIKQCLLLETFSIAKNDWSKRKWIYAIVQVYQIYYSF